MKYSAVVSDICECWALIVLWRFRLLLRHTLCDEIIRHDGHICRGLECRHRSCSFCPSLFAPNNCAIFGICRIFADENAEHVKLSIS